MITFKRGVNLDGITKECLWCMSAVSEHFMLYLDRDIVVTSVNDGRHMKGSRHYSGNAFDLRTWTTNTSGIQMDVDEKHTLAVAIINKIGIDYDVVVEKDHLHIEYDPA